MTGVIDVRLLVSVIFVCVIGRLMSVFRVLFLSVFVPIRRLFGTFGPFSGQSTDSTAGTITVGGLFVPCLVFVDVMRIRCIRGIVL